MPESRATDASDAAGRTGDVAAVVGWCLLGFVMWIVHVQLPIGPAPAELDPSWQQALSRALVQGIRFGRDLVFTFGPLGGPQHARYEPQLFWKQILLYECLFKGLLTWRWIAVIRRVPATLDRTVFVLVNLFLPLAGDAYMFACVLVIGTGLLRPGRRTIPELVLDFGLLAALGYVKFTYFALAAGVGVLVVLHALMQSRREAVKAALLLPVSAIVVWTLCGQSPFDLFYYVFRGAALAGGYSESQAVDGPIEDVHRAFASLSVAAALAFVHVFSARDRRAALLTTACAAGGAFVAFRASFTCHGDVAVTFFWFMLVFPIALLVPTEAARGWRTAAGLLRAVTIVLALSGFTRGFQGWVTPDTLVAAVQSIERNIRDFGRLPELRGQLENKKAQLEGEFALPRLRARIGTGDVDFLGDFQAWVFLNNLRWNPRPVLQSYAATTVGLAELDAEFYRGARAPRFVMWQSGGVFMRLEGTDDGPAFREILRCYRPVAIERGVLLFERNPPEKIPPPPVVRRLATIEAREGELVRLLDLPGRVHVVRFDVKYSLLGKLRSFFFHAPITQIELTVNDQIPRRRRLVPSMVEAGVLLRPMIEYPEDWIDQYTRGVDKVALGFRVGSAQGWDAYYKPTYRVAVDGWDEPLPALEPEARVAVVYGCFPTPPLSENASYRGRYFHENGREYVLVGATTTLTFALAPGAHQLVGVYGLLPGIVQLTDGVDYEVRVVSASGAARSVFARTLDKTAADAQGAQFDVRFDSVPGDKLEIRTSNPPERNGDYDLPYFEKIEIRSLP
jgi:hypothetical protein